MRVLRNRSGKEAEYMSKTYICMFVLWFWKSDLQRQAIRPVFSGTKEIWRLFYDFVAFGGHRGLLRNLGESGRRGEGEREWERVTAWIDNAVVIRRYGEN